PGDRQGVGHAPGRARLHSEADQPGRPPGQDRRARLMADRVSLREYQLGLSERLQSAEAGARVPSKLGLEVGGEGWLIDLKDAGEVIPVPPISPVPLARPWFKGVANVRGNLYSVTDFPAFLGGEAVPASEHARLLLISERFRSGAALLVER